MTDKLHPLQESIRIQLGLDPPEPEGPPEGMKSWLSEFEPDIHSSLYEEDEDEDEVLDESWPDKRVKKIMVAKTKAKQIALQAQELITLLDRAQNRPDYLTGNEADRYYKQLLDMEHDVSMMRREQESRQRK